MLNIDGPFRTKLFCLGHPNGITTTYNNVDLSQFMTIDVGNVVTHSFPECSVAMGNPA